MPDLKKMLTLEALSEALPSWLKRSTKPEYNADEIDSTLTTNQFVTASDKENWNAKGTYSKPSGGIPKSDLSSIVQTSLEKADSALQSETDPTVPSWAKQPNKPSYTQDEVPDGSTYKRVTQTEKNAWNGKQNALSTTQMQAVNSGITSAGVTQISTNQTNILYVLGRTGKNLYDIMHPTRAVNITVTDDGNGQFTQTASGAWAAWDYDFDVTVGTQYTVYIKFKSVTTSNAAGAVVLKDANGNDIYRTSINTPQTFEYTFTAPTSWVRIGVTANNSSYNKSGTFVMQDPMVVEKAVYDKFSDYQPYQGRPNYDLTYLQAEDRAGLVECVDSGAKNLLQLAATTNTSVSGCHVTFSGTASASATQWYGVEFTVPTSGSYVFAVKATSGTIPTTALYNVTDDANVKLYDNGTGGNDTVYLQTGKRYKVGSYLHSGTSYNQQLDVMICTKAAFGVSNKFVPYRGVIPSNIVLAQTIATTPTETIVPSLTITIPAYYRADIKACLNYSNGVPVTIRILDSDSIAPSTTLGLAQQESANYKLSSLCTTALTSSGGADKKIYFSAQSANSSNNTMIVIVNLYPAN